METLHPYSIYLNTHPSEKDNLSDYFQDETI